jgi:cysteine desulfurase
MLLMGLDMEGVAASGGSACASGSNRGSHVVAALYGPDDPHAHVRFSLGRMTRPEHVDRAVAALLRVLDRMAAA